MTKRRVQRWSTAAVAALTLVPAVTTSLATNASDSLVVISSSVNSASCLGVLIAPTSILASMACLEHNLELSSWVFGAQHVTIQSTTEHRVASIGFPSDDEDSFALLRFKKPMESTTPAMLQAPSKHTTDSLHVASLKNGTTQATKSRVVPETACAPTAMEATNEWLCIDTGICPTDTRRYRAQDGFLLGSDERSQRSVLWGLVKSSWTRCDTKSVGVPGSTLVKPVDAIRSFVTAHAHGTEWTTVRKMLKHGTISYTPQTLLGMNASSSRNDTDDPTVGDSSQSKDTYKPTLGDSNSVVDDPAPDVPVWLLDFSDLGALVTPTRNITTGDRTLAYLVTPRHLVLPRRWLRGNGSTLQWVTMVSGQQIQVHHVISEVEFYKTKPHLLDAVQTEQMDLLVLELVAPVEFAANPLVSSAPQLNVDYADVTFKFADRALSQAAPSDGDNVGDDVDNNGVDYVVGATRFINSSPCDKSATTSSDDWLCANQTYSISALSPRTAGSVVGILEESNSLVGFTLASSNPRQFTVLRLSSLVHRGFLDAATNHLIQWQQEDPFVLDADQVAKYSSYTVALYAADEFGDNEFACSGLLIAPEFVLTTASCLVQAKQFSVVGLQGHSWEMERLVPVKPNYQIPHPLFKSPTDDGLVDLAIVGLEQAVLDISPIALNPGYPAWIQNATFDIMGSERGAKPTQLVDCDVARGNTTNSTQHRFQSQGLCLKQSKPSNQEIFQRYRRGQPLISNASFGAIMASGFSVGTGSSSATVFEWTDADTDEEDATLHQDPSQSSGIRRFSSFADNANFINGYARGVVWGKATPVDVDTATSSSPAYVVGLRITRDGPNFCSGTLVASGYVLTAAHCVSDAMANYVVVSGGLSGPEILPVVRDTVRIHELYGTPHQYSNDAAVLELAIPASAYGVALDLSTDYMPQMRASMYGYGVRTSADLDKPSSVHVVENMPVYTRAECAATLPDIDGSMLCAGGEKGRDACQGDSGGPLVLRTAQTEVLVGIVSAGYGCGLEGIPGVYARASSLVPFVQSYVVGGRFTASSTATPSVTPSSSQPPSPSPSTAANESRSSVDPSDITSFSSNSSSSGGSNPSVSGGTTNANHAPGINAPGTNAPGTNAGSEFESPLLSTVIPKDVQNPVRVALISFLMGDWSTYLEEPGSPLNPLMNPDNELTLRSRGKTDSILTILKQHATKPLYARKDRFARGSSVKSLWDDDRAKSVHAASCTAS